MLNHKQRPPPTTTHPHTRRHSHTNNNFFLLFISLYSTWEEEGKPFIYDIFFSYSVVYIYLRVRSPYMNVIELHCFMFSSSVSSLFGVPKPTKHFSQSYLFQMRKESKQAQFIIPLSQKQLFINGKNRFTTIYYIQINHLL